MTLEKKRPGKYRKVRCPKCDEEIDYLLVITKDSGVLRIKRDKPEYEWNSDIYGDGVMTFEFKCPRCLEVIFTDCDEAERFLMGE
jgi:phage FluMu protein Com